MCATNKCRCNNLRPDILARTVNVQRKAVQAWYDYVDMASRNEKFRTLSCSNQTAHLIAASSVVVVFLAFYSNNNTPTMWSSSMLSLVYVSSTALHAGAQFWMTFVSGLTLYFSLSRHAFGDVQRVLFPRYFTFNSILSAVSLITMVKLHKITWTPNHYFQVGVVALCFMLESLSRIYVAPRVVSSMTEVRELEVEVEGVGKEVGKHDPGVLSKCPEYVQAYSTFRKHHGMMAIANVCSMVCTIIHLCYLAQRINFT